MIIFSYWYNLLETYIVKHHLILTSCFYKFALSMHNAGILYNLSKFKKSWLGLVKIFSQVKY